jgi:hypothetical protein
VIDEDRPDQTFRQLVPWSLSERSVDSAPLEHATLKHNRNLGAVLGREMIFRTGRRNLLCLK